MFVPAAQRRVPGPESVWPSTLALNVAALSGIPGPRFASHPVAASPAVVPPVSLPPVAMAPAPPVDDARPPLAEAPPASALARSLAGAVDPLLQASEASATAGTRHRRITRALGRALPSMIVARTYTGPARSAPQCRVISGTQSRAAVCFRPIRSGG